MSSLGTLLAQQNNLSVPRIPPSPGVSTSNPSETPGGATGSGTGFSFPGGLAGGVVGEPGLAAAASAGAFGAPASPPAPNPPGGGGLFGTPSPPSRFADDWLSHPAAPPPAPAPAAAAKSGGGNGNPLAGLSPRFLFSILGRAANPGGQQGTQPEILRRRLTGI